MASDEKEEGGGVFSRYVRSLVPDEEPGAAGFDAVWAALRLTLYRELRRRGLWRRQPAHLGVTGFAAWTGPGPRDPSRGDALDELAADAYEFVFIDRLANLRDHLRLKPNIDGLVVRAVGHFVHERQGQHDPLGTRLYNVLRTAVLAAVESGELHVVSGDRRIRGDSVLSFAAAVPPAAPAAAEDLRPLVERWGDGLLPEIVTTRGRGQSTLVAALRACILGLAGRGIAAFTFADLLDGLRSDVRRRWTAVFDTARGATALELDEDGLARLVARVEPDLACEDRQTFRRLVDCVGARLDGLERSGEVDEKTAGLLRAIWETLVSWAAEAGTPMLADDRAPSRRELARILGIPRDRLPGLYGILGEAVAACGGGTAGREVTMASDVRKPAETLAARQQALRRATREAVARAVEAERARAEVARPRRRRSSGRRPWLEALAAVLALATVGLGLLADRARRDLERASEPSFAPASEAVVVQDPERGALRFEPTAGGDLLLLDLLFLERPDCRRFRLELLDGSGRVVWTHAERAVPARGAVTVVLPRRFLERGVAALRLHGRCGGEEELLDERTIDLGALAGGGR